MTSRLFWLLLLLIATSSGCLQTRHVEASSVTTCGDCAAHDATYRERRWCGFWPFLPSRVQP